MIWPCRAFAGGFGARLRNPGPQCVESRSPMERCRSGRTGRTRNALSPRGDRGFESLPLRQSQKRAPMGPFLFGVRGSRFEPSSAGVVVAFPQLLIHPLKVGPHRSDSTFPSLWADRGGASIPPSINRALKVGPHRSDSFFPSLWADRGGASIPPSPPVTKKWPPPAPFYYPATRIGVMSTD